MKLLAAAGTMLLMVASAQAGLIIESENAADVRVSTETRSLSKPPVEHIGTIPNNTNRITGSMANQPISKVLASLVPSGWSGYASDPRIKSLKKVTYQGSGRPWPVVLEQVMVDHGLVAKIDWSKKELSINVSESGVR